VSNLVRKKRNLLNKKEEDFIEHKHNISNKGYLSKILASPLLVNLKVWTMWSLHKDKYITVFLAFTWLCIGVTYGLYYEEWSFSESFRFALGAMAASGMYFHIHIYAQNLYLFIYLLLWLWMCIHICIYTYMYTYIWIFVNVCNYTQTYDDINSHVCM
jgi:hypothetical protein